MPNLVEICTDVGEVLASRSLRLVTAESCTGGLIASSLTSIPGSSEWFDGAFVTYRVDAKTRFLGVPSATLDRFGPVSEPVARAMAEGALAKSDADVALSVTGLAGPGGGEVDKPVGTVWLAWACRALEPSFVQAEEHRFEGDRAAIRKAATGAALLGLIRALRASS